MTSEWTSEEVEAARVLGMARPRRPVVRTCRIRASAERSAGSPMPARVVEEVMEFSDGSVRTNEVVRLRRMDDEQTTGPRLVQGEFGRVSGTRSGLGLELKVEVGRVGRGCVRSAARS